MSYNITEIHYRDIYGNLLWKENMIYKRLFAVGQQITENHITYTVKRIALAENVQHINLIRT